MTVQQFGETHATLRESYYPTHFSGLGIALRDSTPFSRLSVWISSICSRVIITITVDISAAKIHRDHINRQSYLSERLPSPKISQTNHATEPHGKARGDVILSNAKDLPAAPSRRRAFIPAAVPSHPRYGPGICLPLCFAGCFFVAPVTRNILITRTFS